MHRLTKLCLSWIAATAMSLPAAGCTDDASTSSQMGTPATDLESNESGSLFASADENKLRREKALASEIARSLLQLEGVAQARLHLSLADNASLLKSSRKQSHAAVLIVHSPNKEPNQKNIREFILAAVPDLPDENLRIIFTRTEALPERIVTVGGLKVAEGSVTPLKTVLAVLLCTAVLAAVGLILAGVTIRRLRSAQHHRTQENSIEIPEN